MKGRVRIVPGRQDIFGTDEIDQYVFMRKGDTQLTGMNPAVNRHNLVDVRFTFGSTGRQRQQGDEKQPMAISAHLDSIGNRE
jgi:hypothetical protein